MPQHVHNIETYQDNAGEWRWRISVTPGTPGGEKGDVVADSGEGYKNKKDMLTSLFGMFFATFDESFLTLYAELFPPNADNPVPNNDPAESQA